MTESVAIAVVARVYRLDSYNEAALQLCCNRNQLTTVCFGCCATSAINSLSPTVSENSLK